VLLDRLLRVVARLPERECIVDGDRRVTYGEVGAEVLAVGAKLRERIGPGDRVAVLMDNSPEYVAACYGTWIAGGAVVGLNTALKAPALAHLIGHCGASCLLTDPAHPEVAALRCLLPGDVAILPVEPGMGLQTGPATDDVAPILDTSLASLVYTSGTTGHPKGVMLSHRNLETNTNAICAYLAINERDRSLCVLPFSYSYGASVLHSHLATGATLVAEKSFMYPHRVLERMVAERVTSFAGVPSTFYLLLRRTDLAAYDLSSLRYVTQAGGRMDPDRIRQLRDLIPEADFVVMYGQTEATARLAYVPPDQLDRKVGSAGKAIPGVELRVRDYAGRDLEVGDLGEVCARGENVMMGYWADPQETEKVLRDGWLRTGDLGHMDAEGYLFLTGRAREMIKTGAHRVSPAEIEEVIHSVAGVDDVAVVGMDDDVLGEAIKACVISTTPTARLKQDVQKACRDRLPLFKVPKVVEFKTDFPRTASGKIRRHLL
jgi:acyl-CoA synthetase (AMP-forming)/AMP-acid ligase II